MSYGKVGGLTPAMQGKYWGEVIKKESHEHLSHALNTAPHLRRNHMEPPGNPKDFYKGTWCMLERRYDQAAGCPSPLVDMARRYTGLEPNSNMLSRPATGASSISAPNVSARPVTGMSMQSRRSQQSQQSGRSSRQRALGA
ncbi:unnamed protein product [Polarella glacialis]|uniref:Uncharacterized protein n=2 Tax=Polarella glacialis TaxID=89957 RepID=A0A813LFU5_POLGL|nr:unnamed protein product [Polarella glacialis]